MCGISNVSQLLTATNVIAIIINIMDLSGVVLFNLFRPTTYIQTSMTRGISFSTVQFFIQAPIFFICMMYALVSYNNLQHEMCFHCKYGFFVTQFGSVLILTFLMVESMPWKSLLVAFGIFCTIVFAR